MKETEPVRVSAAVEALLLAIFPVFMYFGWITVDEKGAALIMAAIIGLVKFVGAIVTRSLVWAPSSVNEVLYSSGEPELPPTG